MREILFRGKRRDKGEWVFGDLTTHSHTAAKDIAKVIYGVDEWAEILYTTIIEGKHYVTNVNSVLPKTVGQFTGLTDKNGNKIFEGDIVEVNHDAYPGARGEVFFRNGSFMLEKVSEVLSLYGFLPWCEVIGNIHDNPELLEG